VPGRRHPASCSWPRIGAGHSRIAPIGLLTYAAIAASLKDLLEYVVVHEMAHLLAPTHNERFIAILDEHYPTWREARAELNELPLAVEAWLE